MDEEISPNSMELQTIDYVTSAAKAALSTVPFAGSLLAEVAGMVIPNQRIERIVKFAKILDSKISSIDQDIIRMQFTNENFTDLLEEGLRQAARSLTDERREYIASVIANSISSDQIDFLESKFILHILGELNDIEIIWLRFYLTPYIQGDEGFRSKHKGIIETPPAHIGASQKVIDKDTLKDGYREHLVQRGLLKHKYDMDHGSGLPEFDRYTGGPKVRGYELTPLGRLLLREAGLTTL